jgi:hypothetical protein
LLKHQKWRLKFLSLRDSAGLTERKILLDIWVLDVVVVVDPIPGRKKANRKTAYVTLRSAPDLPCARDL